MSLELLLNIICDLALKRNLVGYAAAGPSIYRLNAETIRDYPFIFVSPTNNVVTRKNFTDYTLTLFYVDRLLLDSANETHIFSIANDTLVNLLRQLKQLEGIVDISEPTVRLFTETEKMSDRCAGGYTDITITVLNDAECPVIMDETGEMIGTYIPRTLQDLNVLDNLASKNWVIQYMRNHMPVISGDTVIISGIDEDEAKGLINQALTAYTKTNRFATFNGSGITDNGAFNFVEQSVYNEQLNSIYAAISAATPQGYDTLVSSVTENHTDIVRLEREITDLSGVTETFSGSTVGRLSDIDSRLSGFSSDLATLSTQVSANSAQISANTENISTISGATSALSTQVTNNFHSIETLSGQTSAISQDLAVLSASTVQGLSGLSSDISALSGATSDALAGKQDALTAGDNITIENNVISTIYKVWSGTQAEYNAIEEKDAFTIYIITDAIA